MTVAFQAAATLPSADGRLSKSVKELYALSETEIASYDIAELNLLTAQGLPGAEDLDIPRYLSEVVNLSTPSS